MEELSARGQFPITLPENSTPVETVADAATRDGGAGTAGAPPGGRGIDPFGARPTGRAPLRPPGGSLSPLRSQKSKEALTKEGFVVTFIP